MAAPVEQNKYAHLKTNQSEYIKSYIIYDGSGRMITIYEAKANAIDGTPCLRTDYGYDGATSRIAKMKETEDVWDDSYEL